jgi:hypothetical protein
MIIDIANQDWETALSERYLKASPFSIYSFSSIDVNVCATETLTLYMCRKRSIGASTDSRRHHGGSSAQLLAGQQSASGESRGRILKRRWLVLRREERQVFAPLSLHWASLLTRSRSCCEGRCERLLFKQDNGESGTGLKQ